MPPASCDWGRCRDGSLQATRSGQLSRLRWAAAYCSCRAASAPLPLKGGGDRSELPGERAVCGSASAMTALAALLVRDMRLAVRVGGGALMGVLFFLLVVTMVPFG